MLADSAYASGELLTQLATAGHSPIIKPMPLNRAVPGGFTVDDFTVNDNGSTLTCPAGITRKITPKATVTFGAACSSCPLRTQCTTATRGRTMTLTPHDRIKREHRAQAKEPDFQAIYRQHRPMAERSIAWMTRGARRVPYRGVAKNHAWWVTRAAGINLKRLLNLGLTRQNAAWVLG